MASFFYNITSPVLINNLGLKTTNRLEISGSTESEKHRRVLVSSLEKPKYRILPASCFNAGYE